MANKTINQVAQGASTDPVGFDPQRYSLLIAQGQIDLLFDVPHDRLEKVVEMVREHSRKNLVCHIARCIAAALSDSQTEGESDD